MDRNMSMPDTSPSTIKCVVVGDAAVGKTSLLTALTLNPVNGYQENSSFETMQTEFVKRVRLRHDDDDKHKGEEENSEFVDVKLIDTAGEEHDTRGQLHYPSADVFLLCFSIISPTSLASILDKWYVSVRKVNEKAPIILVGMKVDLRDDAAMLERLAERGMKPVTQQQGKEMQRKIDARDYFEISTSEIEVLDLLVTEVVREAVGKPDKNNKNKRKNKSNNKLPKNKEKERKDKRTSGEERKVKKDKKKGKERETGDEEDRDFRPKKGNCLLS